MKIFGLKTRKPYPTKLTVDVNTQCNAKCIICPYPQLKNKIRHGVMKWNLYKKIIDNYAKICYSNKIMGELSYCNMSEPTLLPNFPEFVKYARDKKCFTIYFNTNGSNLSSKMIDTFIKEKTFPAVHLNILGFSKTSYEKSMGLDFDNLLNNLNYLLKKYPHSLIDIGFFTPLMQTDEINQAESFFKNTKVTLHLGKDISNRAGNITLPEELLKNPSPLKKMSFACSKNRPIHRMHINFNGKVYLCDQEMSMDTDFGNIQDSSIKDIWNGKKINETLKAIYGITPITEPTKIPCLRCTSCIDRDKIQILDDQKEYKPRKLFGPLKRWFVKNGWAVVRKRGKLAYILPIGRK
ncbi:MAG: SPASM domain-containing protein [bacterium]